MGLDRDKRPIDALTSNMGHCLWTGIVDDDKADIVAAELLSDEMFSGWGIRTLASSMSGYNPISYHNGSVWPHDTAICAAGLMRYGFSDAAHRVMEGIVARGRVVRKPPPRTLRRVGTFGVLVPGRLSDVVLPAGVGGRVAAVVPAFHVALRPRRAQRVSLPAARRARVDRAVASRAHPAHGREPFDRGRGRRVQGARGARGPHRRAGTSPPDDLSDIRYISRCGKSRSPNSKPSARAAAITSSLVEGRVPRPGVTDSSPSALIPPPSLGRVRVEGPDATQGAATPREQRWGFGAGLVVAHLLNGSKRGRPAHVASAVAKASTTSRFQDQIGDLHS